MNTDLVKLGRRGIFALLFEGGAYGAVQSFGAFMSSPWTIERTASSPDAAAATRKYIAVANIFNLTVGALVSLWARSWGAFLGAAAGTGLMTMIYRYSCKEGLRVAADWWGKSGFGGPAAVSSTGRRRR